MAIPSQNLIPTLKEASEIFQNCSKKLKILSVISWDGKMAVEFFKKKEQVLPTPIYRVDKNSIVKLRQDLEAIAPKLKGEHPVLQWLERTRQSYALAARLLSEVGTRAFYEISTELYGNSRTQLFEGQLSNLELATQIANRLSPGSLNQLSESSVRKDASEFAKAIENRINERIPQLPVKVEITNDIAAKVVAGMNRVRIRSDARFSELEIEALWYHEIESHSLTANNGMLQENCDFLCSGGPRTTMTQEGLAVFFEMYGHSMSQRRFMALCDRVQAIHMAEGGADFFQVYKWYKERADNELEAFFAASRIFRGSDLTKPSPFTKDVVYLAGLLGVFHFLKLAVKNQNYPLVESLICGRMALEDVGTVAFLRTHGILSPPRYVPLWLKNWEALLSFFSFAAVIYAIDITAIQKYFDSKKLFQEWDFSL